MQEIENSSVLPWLFSYVLTCLCPWTGISKEKLLFVACFEHLTQGVIHL